MAINFGGLTLLKKHSFGSFIFDATLMEDHRHENTVTQQPVEFGAELTDHAFVQPARVTIVGEVTDTPAQPNPSFDNGSSQARSSSAFQDILQLKNSRELFDIQTGLLLYSNMLIERMSARQSAETANTMILTINCLQIKQVNINETAVPKQFLEEGQTQNQAQDIEQQGNKQTTNPTAEQQASADSALISLYGSAKRFVTSFFGG